MIAAHQLDDTGKIINTILVGSLDDFPDLTPASIGGTIGDSIVEGKLVPASVDDLCVEEYNAPILAQLAEIDAKSIRPLREGETARVRELAEQAAILRSQLRKA
jgi:hypothetical protein